MTDISAGTTPLQATVSVDADRADVVLTGEIDRLTAPALADLLEATMRGEVTQLDLHLAGVTFVDVGGLRALVGAHHLATRRGITLTLRQPTPQTQWLLQITNATVLLDDAITPDDCRNVSPVKRVHGGVPR